MIHGEDVHSGKWSDAVVLFDDGVFTAIWGRYEEGPKRVLGLRWNGDDKDNGDIGYPKTFGHPTWFVVPTEITGAVLSSLLERVWKGGHGIGKADEITSAYQEFTQQIFVRQPMLVVALYAAQSKGKTSTLNALIDLIVAKEGKVLFEEPSGGQDRQVVLNYKGLIVGVCTGGDVGDIVDVNFKMFDDFRCDVAFCATRKRSDSSSWTQFWEHTGKRGVRYAVEEKVASPNDSTAEQQAVDNSKRAHELLEQYLCC